MPRANPRAIAVAAAKRHGVPVRLYLKQMGMESGFRADARSPKNAYGWVQIHLPSHPDVTEAQAADPNFAFDWGAKTMRRLFDKYKRWDLALAGYNAGEGAVDKYGGIPPYRETQKYVKRIMNGLKIKSDSAPAPPQAETALSSGRPDLVSFSMQMLSEIAGGEKPDPIDQLGVLTESVASAPEEIPTEITTEIPTGIPAGGDWQKWVKLSGGADRAEVRTGQGILDFVGQIGQAFGKPITVGTGTNHNQFVTGTRRQSAHWTGNAADIPATGYKLRQLGYLALLAAGMPKKQALRAKKTGGLFNVGGHQIIFATNEGGNHHDHVHVGLRGH